MARPKTTRLSNDVTSLSRLHRVTLLRILTIRRRRHRPLLLTRRPQLKPGISP